MATDAVVACGYAEVLVRGRGEGVGGVRITIYLRYELTTLLIKEPQLDHTHHRPHPPVLLYPPVEG